VWAPDTTSHVAHARNSAGPLRSVPASRMGGSGTFANDRDRGFGDTLAAPYVPFGRVPDDRASGGGRLLAGLACRGCQTGRMCWL
jgi:hypothetical protein